MAVVSWPREDVRKRKGPDAASAARKVGRMLASEKFARLNNHSIQDIETWDDADEEMAQELIK